MKPEEQAQTVRFWPIMIAIFFGTFLAVLANTTVNVAIPMLMDHFQSPLSSIQWTMTGFMLMTGTVAPLVGYLGDRFSYKKLYVTALVGFTLFSGLCAFAWDSSSLIVFRMLQGSFSGLVMPATMTIIYQVIPREKQPFAMSLWSLSAMLAPAVGPTLSGFLIDAFSWQWLFLMNVPIGVVAIVMVLWLVPYYKMNVPKSFDAFGLVTVVVGSLSLLIAFSEGHNWGWTSARLLGLTGFGAIALLLFIRRQLRSDQPLLQLRILRNTRYSTSLLLSSIITVGLYAGSFLTPLFLQTIQQATPLEAGLILLPSSMVMALMMPITGKLYVKVGPFWLILAGVALIALGTYEMGRLSVDVSHGYVMFWMSVRNIGVALSTMPSNNAGMMSVPRELSGQASSINNWVRQVIASFSIGLFSSMLASRTASHAGALAAAGTDGLPAVQLQSFTLGVNDVYMLATVIMILCIPLVFLLRRNAAGTSATGVRTNA
ncbi:DHA2 family efflux MFS transporter permease subunit [Paenibacillus contaminans]|uniref:MFS transporter n=1 Tax=Paenibacillus contaminans TaxID=450362 RepID=A0A329MH68_9BACL|nr:DHA2 family efflux MFS transporter permease subunit [Paenibacillus contaminans]RAV19291.1 MFS transporter [Paenibacillus contaminans]